MLKQAFPELKPIRLDRRFPVAVQIFDHLRSQIISLQLAPGMPLSRPGLSESFGVSQTPIREALLRLEEQALVIVYPQSSTLVAPIDVAQAEEAQFMRIALECEVARTITLEPARYDLTGPARLLAEMRIAWEGAKDKPTFIYKDLAYHAMLFAATGRERLWDLVVQRSGNVDRLRNLHLPTPGKAAQILADHVAHLDALVAGDCAQAQAVLRRHLTGTLRAVGEIRAAHPQFFR
jgi:DNA-binding GntR family transcriptional regulator